MEMIWDKHITGEHSPIWCKIGVKRRPSQAGAPLYALLFS